MYSMTNTSVHSIFRFETLNETFCGLFPPEHIYLQRLKRARKASGLPIGNPQNNVKQDGDECCET